MPWGVAAAVGGSVISGVLGSDASDDAADAQERSSQASIDEQRRQFDISQQNLQPWLQTGAQANYRLADYLGLQTPLFGGRAGTTMASATGRPAAGGQTATASSLTDAMRSVIAPALGYSGGFGGGEWANYLASRGLQDEWQGLKQSAAAPSAAISGSGLPTNVRDSLARTLGYTGSFGGGGFANWLSQSGKQNQWQQLVNQFRGQAPQGAAGAAAKPGGGTQPSSTFGSLLQPFTGAGLVNEPGYQFGLAEGNKSIDRAALARGGWDSGATLKALQRYGQDYAGTKYTDAFNRDMSQKQNIYNMLAGLSGTGQVTGGQIGQLGANAATNIGNAQMGAGNARAAGIVGGANAWNSAISQGLQGYQNYKMNDWLNQQQGLNV